MRHSAVVPLQKISESVNLWAAVRDRTEGSVSNMFEVLSRSATLRETKLLTKAASVDVSAWAHVFTRYTCGFAVAVALIGIGLDWWTARLGLHWAPWGSVAGGSLGILLGASFLLSYHRIDGRGRAQAKADLASGQSLTIQVADARAVRFEIPESKAPALCLQVAPDRVLLLWGSFLLDADTYQIDPLLAERDELSLTGFGGGFGFPSTRFELHRAPGNGHVLSIDLLGDLQPALATTYQPTGGFRFPESALFEGSIHRLAETLRPERMLPFTPTTDPDSLLPAGTSPALRAMGAAESGMRSIPTMDQLSVDGSSDVMPRPPESSDKSQG